MGGWSLDTCLPFILMDGGSVQAFPSHRLFSLPVLSFFCYLFYLFPLCLYPDLLFALFLSQLFCLLLSLYLFSVCSLGAFFLCVLYTEKKKKSDKPSVVCFVNSSDLDLLVNANYLKVRKMCMLKLMLILCSFVQSSSPSTDRQGSWVYIWI